MLEINDVSLRVPSPDGDRELLSQISARFPLGHFGAIIGPSGCGKTTLLKLVAGIVDGEEDGMVFWKGRNLDKEDFLSTEISYVPQFSIAHEELTVRECVDFAMRLRVCQAQGVDRTSAVSQLLSEVRMEEFADHRVQVLSGGQRRRLALAMEMTSQPDILLCDEVTSGLDPRSEDEIVRLLHNLSRRNNRLVLSVTHSLEHLNLYDSVLVLYRGIVAYQGPPAFLSHYFSVDSPNKLYERLELREPSDWAASWKKHHEAIEKAAEPEPLADPAKKTPAEESPEPPAPPVELPNMITQFLALLERRMLIFTRSRAQIFLQLGLILGFPLLVAVFAWNGLPAVMNLSMGLDLDLARQLSEARDFLIQSSKVGSLVSGIVMFQVILLTLMGANNSGREIAAERRIFEKEKLAGLSTGSYVASKAVFLLGLVLAQSIWMGIFVHHVCGFPGDFVTQLVLLVLVNAAMTSLCLGVSSLMSSAEQSSLVSIYLVGFQLPLSGAVLALPTLLGDAVRPFICAYWSWSGILQTLKSERYYDIVQTVVQSPLSPLSLCLWLLGAHIAAGLIVAWIGCEKRQLV
jgi:ABC-type multidrug transport system ATPase subunit